uniref:Uncharacterized protein n=1 Tax=Spongospora subterranea TaxID=70186 RepID=A0A0H5RSE8_9EUKA|eukprot:CRZ11664.1 hypothetical protein [Spongospora subterranea]
MRLITLVNLSADQQLRQLLYGHYFVQFQTLPSIHNSVFFSKISRFNYHPDRMKSILSALSQDDISSVLDNLHQNVARLCSNPRCFSSPIQTYDHAELYEALNFMKIIYEINLMAKHPLTLLQFTKKCFHLFQTHQFLLQAISIVLPPV